MIRVDNHMGKIEISSAYFANLIGHVASECFGVAGLVNSTASQGFRSVVKGPVPDKGVCVSVVNGGLVIDLHIAVTYGVNISVIVKSIINKVTYSVKSASGLNVSKVNVYIASMKAQ